MSARELLPVSAAGFVGGVLMAVVVRVVQCAGGG